MQVLGILNRSVSKYRRKCCSCLNSVNYCTSVRDKLRILFFGTDNFSLPSLNVLNEDRKRNGKVEILEIVTSFKATKNPLKSYSKIEGLALHNWPLKREISGNYDLGVVVSFGHLIPENLISSFPLGIINVHASLLPKLRGAAPIIHAIRNGDEKTGITIMKIRPNHFDVGEILLQKECQIEKDMFMPELHDKLADIGAQGLIEVVKNLSHFYSNKIHQNEAEATYAPKIKNEFCQIRWHLMISTDIFNLYRSLYSYKPLLTNLGKELVKINEISLKEDDFKHQNDQPGSVEYSWKDKCLKVVCSDQRCIRIHQLNISGRKIMSAIDFNNGYLKKIPKENRKFVE